MVAPLVALERLTKKFSLPSTLVSPLMRIFTVWVELALVEVQDVGLADIVAVGIVAVPFAVA